jgi:hypothetical protein
MQHLWKKWMFDMLQFDLGGIIQGMFPKVQFTSLIIGWVSRISM